MTYRPETPQASYVREALDYNPETGEFCWRNRPTNHFAGSKGHDTFNRMWAGKIAGTIKQHGYVAICLDKKLFYAHRLAFLFINGEWPLNEIDHIDGNRRNNAAFNLREANHSQNCANMRRRPANLSGVKGVRFDGKINKFVANIMCHGKQHHIGCFRTLEEAAEARRAAAVRLHGEFARHE